MDQLLPRSAPVIKGKRQIALSRRALGAGLGALLLWRPGIGLAEETSVSEVRSGQALVLVDGRAVRLAYIEAPLPPLHLAAGSAWLPAQEAQQALTRLVVGQPVALEGEGRDRYGRLLRRVYLADGRLLQAVLLGEGQARFVSLPEDADLAEAMVEAEALARRAGRGLWAHPDYRIRPALPERLESGRFQVVIGRIVSANRVRRGAYLNFGGHWKSDVTLRLDENAAVLLEERAGPVEALAGRRVLFRGWVQERDGPLIEIADHRLIAFLD